MAENVATEAGRRWPPCSDRARRAAPRRQRKGVAQGRDVGGGAGVAVDRNRIGVASAGIPDADVGRRVGRELRGLIVHVERPVRARRTGIGGLEREGVRAQPPLTPGTAQPLLQGDGVDGARLQRIGRHEDRRLLVPLPPPLHRGADAEVIGRVGVVLVAESELDPRVHRHPGRLVGRQGAQQPEFGAGLEGPLVVAAEPGCLTEPEAVDPVRLQRGGGSDGEARPRIVGLLDPQVDGGLRGESRLYHGQRERPAAGQEQRASGVDPRRVKLRRGERHLGYVLLRRRRCGRRRAPPGAHHRDHRHHQCKHGHHSDDSLSGAHGASLPAQNSANSHVGRNRGTRSFGRQLSAGAVPRRAQGAGDACRHLPPLYGYLPPGFHRINRPSAPPPGPPQTAGSPPPSPPSRAGGSAGRRRRRGAPAPRAGGAGRRPRPRAAPRQTG